MGFLTRTQLPYSLHITRIFLRYSSVKNGGITEEDPSYMQAVCWRYPEELNHLIMFQIRFNYTSNGLIFPLSSLLKGG